MITPELSVIVPFFNAEPTLGRCLEALDGQRLAPERYEIIAVDNNSTDGSAVIARRFPPACRCCPSVSRVRTPRGIEAWRRRAGACSPSPIRIVCRPATGCRSSPIASPARHPTS